MTVTVNAVTKTGVTAAMATLNVTTSGSNDFTLDTTLNVTDILFNTTGFATAVFLASQFDNTHISQSVQITGDGNSNAIIVALTAPGTFSAAACSFVTWTIADSVSINGTAGVDTITGGDAASGNLIVGHAGADQLTGGSGPDLSAISPGLKSRPARR